MNICIINCVSLNGGDAAILYSLKKILRLAYGDNIDITVFDSQATVAQKYYPEFKFRQMATHIPRNKVHIIDRIRRRIFYIRWIVGLLFARLRLHNLGRNITPPSVKDQWTAYNNADLIISTGGTYLVEHYDLNWRFFHLMTAAYCNRPFIMFTQSLGPFNSRINQVFIKLLLPRIDLLLLRDERSLRHIAHFNRGRGIDACIADGVFALADETRLARTSIKPPTFGPRIAISVRKWGQFSNDNSSDGMARYQSAITEAVCHLVRDKAAQITFLSTCQGIPEYWTDDSDIARIIWSKLPDDVRDSVIVDRKFRTPEALITELGKFNLTIATRMHAAIMSLIAGTPVLPIAYEFKTRELFNNLDLGGWVQDIDSLSGIELINLLDKMLPISTTLLHQIHQAVGAQRLSALDAVRLMLDVHPRLKSIETTTNIR